MYAVIKTGGKQYRVQAGDVLVVEKLDQAEVGVEVAFDQVLMVGGEAGVTVGAPTVDGAVVRATLIETRKGEKIKVFKKIRRQGYRRTQGHRQPESVLRVTGLEGAGQSAKWDGEVDLTPRAVLVARARGLAPMATTAEVEAQPETAPVAETAASTTSRKAAKPAPIPEDHALVEQAAPEAAAAEEASAKKTRARKPKAAPEATEAANSTESGGEETK